MRNGKHYPPKFASPSSWARPRVLRNPRRTLTAPACTFLQDHAPRSQTHTGHSRDLVDTQVVTVLVTIPTVRGFEHIRSILPRTLDLVERRRRARAQGCTRARRPDTGSGSSSSSSTPRSLLRTSPNAQTRPPPKSVWVLGGWAARARAGAYKYMRWPQKPRDRLPGPFDTSGR